MGVYVAGMAGEYAAEQQGEYSMTPMDTVNYIGAAIEEMLVDYIEADTVQKKTSDSLDEAETSDFPLNEEALEEMCIRDREKHGRKRSKKAYHRPDGKQRVGQKYGCRLLKTDGSADRRRRPDSAGFK